MLKNAAFVGYVSTNPFHFHHYDIKNLVVYVNGTTHNGLVFAVWSYQGLRNTASSTGIHHVDCAHMITLDMFSNGF